MTTSWSDTFFENASDVLPCFQGDWTTDPLQEPQIFRYEKLRLSDRPLVDRPAECPILVWPAEAIRDGQKCRLIVKAFKTFTEVDARFHQEIRSSQPHNLQDIQRDIDPYLLELRVFERIRQFCPQHQKIYFPRYHGIVTINRTQQSRMYYVFPRGIVMDFMKSNLECRYILSAEVPDYFRTSVERLQGKLAVLGISGIEAEWYQSLLIDRLRVLTVLHSLAITHGDLKEEHFRLSGDFHDIGLFDFSRSYTFTPDLLYAINGGPFKVKKRPPRTFKRVVELERSITTGLVELRAESREFRHHVANSLQLNHDEADSVLNNISSDSVEELELMVLRASTQPESFSFPSLSSILPFLESATPKLSFAWAVSRASLLHKYNALWLKYFPRSKDTAGLPVFSIIPSSGTRMLKINQGYGAPTTEHRSTDTEPEDYFVLLIPQWWTCEKNFDISRVVRYMSAAPSCKTSPFSVITKRELHSFT